MPITASTSIEELVAASLALNFWIPFRQPPKNNASPRIKSTLPVTEPMIDARAMSLRPALIASTTITISGRLPNEAFSSADARGPTVPPACSVASPRSQANPIRATAAITNISCPSSPPTRATIATTARASATAAMSSWRLLTGTRRWLQ